MLRATRCQLGEVQAQVTLHGSVYGATEGIIRKIDELARWLTGESGLCEQHGTTCGARQMAPLGCD
jgi:hypothetical protein